MGQKRKRVVTLRNFQSELKLWICTYYRQGRGGYGVRHFAYVDAPEHLQQGQKVKASNTDEIVGKDIKFSYIACVNEHRTKHHAW